MSGRVARVRALVLKDAAELARHPGALIPAFAMGAASLIPPFVLLVAAPLASGESLADSGEFSRGADLAVQLIPELRGLSGDALVQAFVLHQFLLLLLLVPVVASIAIAAHAIIGEKIARTLEPLLATPIATTELLVAKTIPPLAIGLAVTWSTLLVLLGGVAAVAEPGVWRALVGPRSALLFLVVAPLLAGTAMLLGLIVSSRASDPRSAQQIAIVIILPLVGLFVGQLAGQFMLGGTALTLGAVALAALNLGLLAAAVRAFDRETILMRWR